jgi:hypothetical protein
MESHSLPCSRESDTGSLLRTVSILRQSMPVSPSSGFMTKTLHAFLICCDNYTVTVFNEEPE